MRLILTGLLLAVVAGVVSCSSQAAPAVQFAVLCDVPPGNTQTYVVTVPRSSSDGYVASTRQAVIKVWGRLWKASPDATISDVWFYCEQLDNGEVKGSAGYLPVNPQDWRVAGLVEKDGVGGVVRFTEWGRQTATRRIFLSDTGPQVGPWVALSLPQGWKALP